jgi:hypothetical protein
VVCGPLCWTIGLGVVSGVAAYLVIQAYLHDQALHQLCTSDLKADEQEHVDRIDRTKQWIDDHPDIADEASGLKERLPHGDHVKDAEQKLRELERSVQRLLKDRKYRNAAAQNTIDHAVGNAEEYMRILREKLGGQ